MPTEIRNTVSFSILDWGDFFLAQIRQPMEGPVYEELVTSFNNPPLKGTETPIVFDTTRFDAFTKNESRFLFDLKKSGLRVSLLCNEKYVSKLVSEGIDSAIPHGNNIRKALQAVGENFRPKMDADLINPFLEGTLRVMGSQTGNKISVGKPYVIKEETPSDICGLIPLSSSVITGMVTLEFPKATITQIASKVKGKDIKEVNEDAIAVVTEITNLVHGTSMMKLDENGFLMKRTAPAVISNAALPKIAAGKLSIGIPVDTGLGSAVLSIRVDT
jgi:chemotaxis protein CheX